MVLGASAYVLNPMHSLERDAVVHRRHAHGLGASTVNARSPVANANASNVSNTPMFSRAERRALRLKRCLAQGGAGNNSPDTPVNNTPNPGQDQGQGQDQGEQTDENPPTAGQPGNSNPPASDPPANSGGDTFSGELTYVVSLSHCHRHIANQ